VTDSRVHVKSEQDKMCKLGRVSPTLVMSDHTSHKNKPREQARGEELLRGIAFLATPLSVLGLWCVQGAVPCPLWSMTPTWMTSQSVVSSAMPNPSTWSCCQRHLPIPCCSASDLKVTVPLPHWWVAPPAPSHLSDTRQSQAHAPLLFHLYGGALKSDLPLHHKTTRIPSQRPLPWCRLFQLNFMCGWIQVHSREPDISVSLFLPVHRLHSQAGFLYV
jgi:hypothetical protein